MRFGAARSGGAGCPSWAEASNWAVLSCAQEIKSCPTSFCVLLTFSEACPAVFGWTVSLSTKARVMYRRLATTSLGRRFQGVPLIIVSALSFQRMPSTFRRTDRAKTAPFSNPMMCSSLLSDFPSQIAVRQRSSSFVRSAVLGSLYQVASPNIAIPDVYSRP